MPRAFDAVRLESIRALVALRRHGFSRAFHLEILAKSDGHILATFVPTHPARWISALARRGIPVEDEWGLLNRGCYASWVNAAGMVTFTRVALVVAVCWVAGGADAWCVSIFTTFLLAMAALFWWLND
ncbi:MAG TPA: hypothetical protein VG826_06890 [Pirellulales bacterium]|nr:hypothetical protein [Pirellulales bacterium]